MNLGRRMIAYTMLAVGASAVTTGTSGAARAATFYAIDLGEQPGTPDVCHCIVDNYDSSADDPEGLTPHTMSYAYNGVTGTNGIAGSYHVQASATPVHGGTIYSFAGGSGEFASLHDSPPSAAGNGYTHADATLYYTFTLAGPASNTPIIVPFDAEAYTKTAGSGDAFAVLQISGAGLGGSVDWKLHSSLGTSDDEKTGPGNDTLALLPNADYTVFENTNVTDVSDSGQGNYPNGGHGQASVDPVFTLPAQYAGLYHFEGLPVAVSAVPLPSSFGLLSLAMTGLMAVRRGSRFARKVR